MSRNGGGGGGDEELAAVVVTLRIVRASTAERIGMTMSANCFVTSVEPGSPASLAGVMRTMQILCVEGTDVSTPADVKAASAGSPCSIALQLRIQSGARLRGKVVSWQPDRGFGSISPEVPLFLAKGVMGGDGSSAVYLGNAFCHSSAIMRQHNVRSLAVEQDVTFVVKWSPHMKKLKAHAVGLAEGATRLRAYVPPVDAPAVRPGADISRRVNGAGSICMMHLGGKCTNALLASETRCPDGVHIENPFAGTPESRKKAAAKKEKEKVKVVTSVEWMNRNNLGEVNRVVFTAGPSKGLMQYKKEGEARPPFGSMLYDENSGGLRMTEIDKKVNVPVTQGRDVLGELRVLADQCGVRHNICANDLQDHPDDTLTLVGAAKLKLLEDQVLSASGGRVRALKAWQLRNDSLEFRFRCAEYNMTQRHGKAPDMIDGFHGSAEQNVLSIATTGFDPLRRCGQAYGAGEYFAKDPRVSVSYARGGGYMFVCKLILGEEDVDHTWESGCGYYIIKQNNGHIQCLPQYLIQFQDTGSTQLYRALAAFATDEKAGEESLRRLGEGQRGGVRPCKGRIDGCMMAASTSQLWVGWLDPSLGGSDAAMRADLCEFLKGYDVKWVRMDRNGARFGAFVELSTSLTQAQLAELNTRPYGKEGHQISVDDAQPENPYMQLVRCPKLHGPGKFCRGWNLRGHGNWTETCSFKHEAFAFPLAAAELEYETLAVGSAKYMELAQEVETTGVGRVTRIRRVVNKIQEATYESRRAFLNTKHGSVTEKELWHGTSCAVLDTVLKKSLQAPSDTNPSDSCPVSGNKGLSTTLCGTDCKHCTEPHKWNMCHMYGHGIYLADMVAKSHRYVRPHKGQHSLVRCRVNLGNPFLIDSNLKQKDGMHHITYAEDPTQFLENNTHTWDTLKGHDSYFVKGLGGAAASGRGVINSEYILFHPAQVLPLYVVDYSPASVGACVP